MLFLSASHKDSKRIIYILGNQAELYELVDEVN